MSVLLWASKWLLHSGGVLMEMGFVTTATVQKTDSEGKAAHIRC